MDNLLQQGVAAYKAGNRDEARKIFIANFKQNPDSEDAWIWMYKISVNDKERIYCLKQILRINPANEKASQRYRELTSSPPTPPPLTLTPPPGRGSFTRKLLIFLGIPLLCCISVIAIGIIFIQINRVTRTSTIETSIPLERKIELTFSAADAQTAAPHSATPLPMTVTPYPPSQNNPTATPYIFTTNTPFILVTQQPPTLRVPIQPPSAVCSCSGDTLNCGDFSGHSSAQACYNYCVSIGKGDIHRLDRDGDGSACEN